MNYKINISTFFLITFIIINIFYLIDIPLLFVNDGSFSLNVPNEKLHNFFSHNVRFMQNTLFFYALVYLFIKDVKIRHILYITPFAYLEVQYSLFSEYLHPILLNSGFYSLFSNNPYNISPEYPRVIFFIVIFFIFIFLLFRKRLFKSIFLTLSMGAVLGTSILFHTLTLKQLDFYTSEQEITFKKLLVFENMNEIYKQCNFLNISCLVVENDKNIFSFAKNTNYIDPKLLKLIKQYKTNIEPYFNPSSNYFYYTISNDNSIKNRINSRKPISFIKNNKLSIVVLDDKNYTKFLKLNQLNFEILSFFSHLVWILGILYLIYFHENRKKGSLVKETTI